MSRSTKRLALMRRIRSAVLLLRGGTSSGASRVASSIDATCKSAVLWAKVSACVLSCRILAADGSRAHDRNAAVICWRLMTARTLISSPPPRRSSTLFCNCRMRRSRGCFATPRRSRSASKTGVKVDRASTITSSSSPMSSNRSSRALLAMPVSLARCRWARGPTTTSSISSPNVPTK